MEYRAPSFLGAVVRGFRLAFQYKDRDTRAVFWPVAFTCVLIPGLAALVESQIRAYQFAQMYPNFARDMFEFRPSGIDPEQMITAPAFEPFPLAWVTIVATAIFAIPYLSAATRRLHDMDMHGYWIWPQIGLYAAAGYASLNFVNNPAMKLSGEAFDYIGTYLFLLGSFMVWTSMLMYFAVHDGDYGDNRFGADPKGRKLTRQEGSDPD